LLVPAESPLDPNLRPLLSDLESGPLHRFADFESVAADLPRTGALVYTIWDDARALIYVGVSGRNPTSQTGPWRRLRAHWTGRRSGNQFAIYVADHYVLPELSRDQIEAIAADDPSLFVDDLVARVVRERFSFRVAIAPDYTSALGVETAVKAGELSGRRPRLNPHRPRRRL
jgi:hypothetical protein